MPDLLTALDAFLQEHRRCGELAGGVDGSSSHRPRVCYTSSPMPDLLTALDAFLQEHRRCGELAGGVDGERVWMACHCGADIVHPVEPPEPACLDR
jgi:hypothetical protein